MHFAIDIDLDAVTGSPEQEVGRILRYWAGALKQMQLTVGTEHELSDSEYKVVGLLKVTD
jgi:hypothetical protein